MCWSLLLAGALLLIAPGLAWGVGESPQNPIVFNSASGALNLNASGAAVGWVRLLFTPSSTSSHLQLETEGSLDTELELYATLDEALAGEPVREDDDSGPGLNASLAAPLGFPSPYLVRVRTSGAGNFKLRASRRLVSSSRCDWPAGCPLALSARGEDSATGVLARLREVRAEILQRSPAGRALELLYWKLGAEILPDLAIDGEFRRRAYGEVTALLPLAEAALAVVRGEGSSHTLTAGEVVRLRGLLDLITARLAPTLAGELEQQWAAFELEAHVGSTLARAMVAGGLVPDDVAGATVLVKLREEPRLELRDGRSRLLSADSELTALLARAGTRDVRRVHRETPERRGAGLTRTVAIRVTDSAAARELVTSLRAQRSVEWAQVSARLEALSSPGRDPFRDDLWGLDAVRAPQAWATSAGSCTTPVAVVDTGLRSDLVDFQGRVLTHLGYDVIDDDPIPQDGHGHGTHVGGTIAAALDNSTSIAGVAPQSCIFGVKVLGDDGSGSSESVAAGIVHAADSGARVINLSLGCDCEVQEAIEDALAYAAARDVVILAATGNDGVGEIFYPASSVWTIAVGAIDSDLDLADFSNYGPGIDVVAPGVDVVSVFRDGESCLGSGTSMATPHASGVAALVRAVNPSLNREAVKALLRAQARDLGAPGYDTRYGSGIVNAQASVAAAGGVPGGGCADSSTAICLSSGRFRAEAFWRRADGSSGQGQVVRLTPDTGYFWFFNPSNVEMFAKVLNACSTGNRFWVFAGGLTNVEVRLRITDTATGQVRDYLNPQGAAFVPIQDTGAFATCGASASLHAEVSAAPLSAEEAWDDLLAVLPAASAPVLATEAGGCVESPTAMCVSGGRFRVEARWRRPNGESGSGQAVRLTSDTGYFWFFNSNNVEMVLKVLNACSFSNRFWVFSGGLTNVEVTITVTDTQTGRVKTYTNPQGAAFRPIQDTAAFATCP